MKNILKGFPYFREAIELLGAGRNLTADTEILLFGKSRGDVADSFHLPVKEFAYVKSQKTMIDLYNVAHIFVIPSSRITSPIPSSSPCSAGLPWWGSEQVGSLK